MTTMMKVIEAYPDILSDCSVELWDEAALLLQALCEEIRKFKANSVGQVFKSIHILQVKEKFGSARIYYSWRISDEAAELPRGHKGMEVQETALRNMFGRYEEGMTKLMRKHPLGEL